MMAVIDDIETSLSAGVSMQYIVDELVACGLEITLATFKTTLKRIRKKRGKPSASPSSPSKSEPNKAKASTVQESPKNEKTEQEQENDYDELAGLSAREKRERRIAKYTTDYKSTNRLYDVFVKDKTK